MPFIFTSPDLKYPATQQVAPDAWILELPFWHVDPVTGEITFIPPSGIGLPSEIARDPVYTTDYRSGGAAVDLIIDKQGAHSAAWLKHDAGYSAETKPRRRLDIELYRDLKETGANLFQRESVYVGVRAAGWNVWRKHDAKQVQRLREWREFCRPLFPLSTEAIQAAMVQNRE